MAPNPSLNADVPHALAHAPRSGPPVSLLRWAALVAIHTSR